MKYIQVFILVLLISMISSCKDETPSNPQDSANGKVNQPPAGKTENTPANTQNKPNPIPGVDFITEKNGKKYYKFRLKMASETSRKHEIYSVTRVSHKVSEVEKAINYYNLFELAETPIKRSDDKITLQLKYLSVEKAEETNGVKNVIVKTADKQHFYNAFQTTVFNAVIQEPITMHMTSLAKIEKIEGSENIVNAVLKGIFGDNPEQNDEFDATKAQFEEIFSESELIQTFHEGYFKLPFEEVSVDESWQDNIVLNISNLGYVAFKITLTLKNVQKIDGKFIAAIELTGKYNEYSDGNDMGENVGITESNYLGSIDFNLTDGCFGHFIRKADLKVSVIGNDDQVTKFVFNCGKEEKIVSTDENDKKNNEDGESKSE